MGKLSNEIEGKYYTTGEKDMSSISYATNSGK